MGPSCHWEKELEPGQPDTAWDIGCMSTQCGSDEDCNPEQKCRAFNVADCWPGIEDNPPCGDYAPSHYCWPLWPDDVTP
jgi:hypothetical protein